MSEPAGPELQRAAALVEREAGMSLVPARLWLLRSRLAERCRAVGIGDLERYVELLEGDDGDAELRALLESLRVAETSFFRGPEHLRALTRTALPGLVHGAAAVCAPARPLRMWCAGCASGEEAYTLAMIVDRFFRERRLGLRFEILATDISDAALTVARAARYHQAAAAPIPTALRERYLERVDAAGRPGWSPVGSLRRAVRFRRHNLANDACPAADLDLVLCRNVLIYFQRELRERVARRLLEAVRPGGFLMLGSGESLGGGQGWSARRTPHGLLYQRPEPGRSDP